MEGTNVCQVRQCYYDSTPLYIDRRRLSRTNSWLYNEQIIVALILIYTWLAFPDLHSLEIFVVVYRATAYSFSACISI